MSITALEESKYLRKQGERLGRPGMSQRAHSLIAEYMAKNPEGHYKECIALVGRLHAIFIATKCDEYWREKSQAGYNKELGDIHNFIPVIDDEN